MSNRVAGSLKITLLRFGERLHSYPSLKFIRRREKQRSWLPTAKLHPERPLPGRKIRKFPAKLLLWFSRFWRTEKKENVISNKLFKSGKYQRKETGNSGSKKSLTQLLHPWQIFLRWLRSDSPLRFDRPPGLSFGQPKMHQFKRRMSGIIFQRRQGMRSGSVVVA